MKNWDKYSKDHYLFILSQSDKELNAQIDVLDSTQKRGQLQTLLAISSATYFINESFNCDSYSPLAFTVAFAVTMGVSAFFGIIGVYKYTAYYPGSSPADLLSTDFYKKEKEKDNELNMLYSECRNQAIKIDLNDEVSRKKVKLVSRSFIFLLLSLPISLFVFLLSLIPCLV